MLPSLAAIRRFLIETFNDEELSNLCFDHFPEVYWNFTADTTLGRKALQLVDYCRRRERVPELLGLLERERPESFRRVFGRPETMAGERRVNLNTATIEELRNLPGIGPRLAMAIIAARPFAAVDDLTRAGGIGPRRLAAVREWCTV